jgi:hypothetical protein
MHLNISAWNISYESLGTSAANTSSTITRTTAYNGREIETSKSKESSVSSAFALMDVVYSSLIALQYPMSDPRVYGDTKGEHSRV